MCFSMGTVLQAGGAGESSAKVLHPCKNKSLNKCDNSIVFMPLHSKQIHVVLGCILSKARLNTM